MLLAASKHSSSRASGAAARAFSFTRCEKFVKEHTRRLLTAPDTAFDRVARSERHVGVLGARSLLLPLGSILIVWPCLSPLLELLCNRSFVTGLPWQAEDVIGRQALEKFCSAGDVHERHTSLFPFRQVRRLVECIMLS